AVDGDASSHSQSRHGSAGFQLRGERARREASLCKVVGSLRGAGFRDTIRLMGRILSVQDQHIRNQHRRAFLRFLAASPLAAKAFAAEASVAMPANVKDVIDIMDFEPLAKKALPPAHWGYMATGVDDDYTLRANREAMNHYQLRARRLIDVSNADLSVD